MMRRSCSGFSLLEIAIALLIIGLLSASLLPLGAQHLSQLRYRDSAALIAEVRLALLGELLINGALPCPRDANGDSLQKADMGCERYSGYLSAQDIDMPGRISDQGLLRDAWGSELLYSVARDASIAHRFVHTDTLIAEDPSLWRPEQNILGPGSADCAGGRLRANRTVFVLVALNRRSRLGFSPAEQRHVAARDLPADTFFDFPYSQRAQCEYDDQTTWLSLPRLVFELYAASVL